MKKSIVLALSVLVAAFLLTGCSFDLFGSSDDSTEEKKDVIVFTEDDIHHEPDESSQPDAIDAGTVADIGNTDESTDAADNPEDAGNPDDGENEGDSADDSSDVKKVTVAGNNVNIRDYPSTGDESKVIGSATAGDEFEFVAEKDDWTQIVYDGKEGYIKTEFLKTE